MKTNKQTIKQTSLQQQTKQNFLSYESLNIILFEVPCA